MNKVVLAGLAMSTAMSLGAQAEPLTLSGQQLDKVTAAGNGFVNFDVNILKDKLVNINETLNINKFANSQVNTFGTLAFAEGDANCSHGLFGCVAESITATDTHFTAFTDTTGGFWEATSHSESVSFTDSPGINMALELSNNGNNNDVE